MIQEICRDEAFLAQKAEIVQKSGPHDAEMKLIQIIKENLVQEHICCAISNEKDPQVSSKRRG